MEKPIDFSPESLEDIDQAVRYLEENFSVQAGEKFLANIQAKVPRISAYPESGRPSKAHPSIRYVLVDKHHRLYYRIRQHRITVLSLFDTRQDPVKSPF